MRVSFADLKLLHSKEVDAAIQDVLDSTSFILGDKVKDFEDRFAEFCGADFCVAVSSGSAALHLALLACCIGPMEEIITVPNSFVATAEAIVHIHATPVFVDVDPQTYNIDPTQIEQAITPSTKAIIPVHLYGQPADMDAILDIADSWGLMVIEDACQAHGAEYKGKKVGAFGAAGCFSFYPAKNLGCYGEGGAVVTNDASIANMVRQFRNHGARKKNYYTCIGFNYRMSAIQGAVLGAKLPHLDEWNNQRRENAQLYNTLLEGVDSVVLPVEAEHTKHVYHQYAVRVKNRDQIYDQLEQADIHTGIHYPVPIHLQESFNYLKYNVGDFPISEALSKETLSLPIYPGLTQEAIHQVACLLKQLTEGSV